MGERAAKVCGTDARRGKERERVLEADEEKTAELAELAGLDEAKAAIDDECLAGDEVRAGGKKEDGLGDVFAIAVAAHGSFGGEASRL